MFPKQLYASCLGVLLLCLALVVFFETSRGVVRKKVIWVRRCGDLWAAGVKTLSWRRALNPKLH